MPLRRKIRLVLRNNWIKLRHAQAVTLRLAVATTASRAVESWLTGPVRASSTRMITMTSTRIIEGGIGHNLPQEAPDAFADAVPEVGGAK
jgi:hypothetical protein